MKDYFSSLPRFLKKNEKGSKPCKVRHGNHTDKFGNPLIGQWVYLYRVVVRLNGEELDNSETGADASDFFMLFVFNFNFRLVHFYCINSLSFSSRQFSMDIFCTLL